MLSPEIQKSSRHSKITGDFAEGLVLYWLSKHGFESARVDHTGIDLIASCPGFTKDMLGISVKSRSRVRGSGNWSVSVFNDHPKKLDDACRAFGCRPYYAIVVDADDRIEAFLASSEVFFEYASPGANYFSWKMGASWRARYAEHHRIVRFQMAYTTDNWWVTADPNH